jgi:hypothetical protein
VVGLPAHFLGNQGLSNATLLPVTLFFHFCPTIQSFKWKSITFASTYTNTSPNTF